MKDWFRRVWNEVGVYKARHPLIRGMWFVGGRLFVARPMTSEEQFLASLPLKGQVVYDIGANVGVMTLFFAKAVGDNGQVVAFEPHPYSFRRLQRNVRMNRLSNVRMVNSAVGASSAQLELFQPSKHLSAATFDREKAIQLREGEIVVHVVKVEPLDGLISRYQLPSPNLIKVDVEGFENNVLLGAMTTIEECRPSWFIEIHCNAEGVATTQQVVETLSSFRYRFLHVESQQEVAENTVHTIRGGHLFCTPAQEETQ